MNKKDLKDKILSTIKDSGNNTKGIYSMYDICHSYSKISKDEFNQIIIDMILEGSIRYYKRFRKLYIPENKEYIEDVYSIMIDNVERIAVSDIGKSFTVHKYYGASTISNYFSDFLNRNNIEKVNYTMDNNEKIMASKEELYKFCDFLNTKKSFSAAQLSIDIKNSIDKMFISKNKEEKADDNKSIQQMIKEYKDSSIYDDVIDVAVEIVGKVSELREEDKKRKEKATDLLKSLKIIQSVIDE